MLSEFDDVKATMQGYFGNIEQHTAQLESL